jgi:hypothetical protein
MRLGLNRYCVVCTLFFITSVLFTLPIFLNLKTYLLGGHGDSFGGVWDLWLRNNEQLLQTKDILLTAPFNKVDTSSISQPICGLIFDIPAVFVGEIAAYNIVVLLSFALTSFTSYLFIYYLLRKSLPAFVGGLISGFCPGAVMQAVGGHLNFTFNMFVPLFFLALCHNRERRTLVPAFFVGLSYALLTLNSLYFGYFSIFIALLFTVFDYITNRKCGLKRLVFNYLLAALFAFVLIIPFQYKTILHIMSTSHIELAKMGHIRDYGELITCSARPLDYFLPSIDHPVLGRFVGDIARSHLHGSNLFEQTLYLGFTPLLLCLAGFFLWSNRRYHILFFPDHARQITRHPCHHYRAPTLCLPHPRSL